MQTTVPPPQPLGRDTPGTVERLVLLAERGAASYTAFEDTGRAAALDEAVELFTTAVGELSTLEGAGPGDEVAATLRANLATALLTRHSQVTSDVADLRRALDLYQELAAQTAGQRPPGFWAALQVNLARTYLLLYQTTNDPQLLSRAAELQQEPAGGASADDGGDPVVREQVRGSLLDVVAAQALTCFARTGSLRDLDRAIDAQAAAARQHTEDSPRRVAMLVNLAHCYHVRFESLRDVSPAQASDMLRQAIDTVRQVLRGTPGAIYQPQAVGLLGSLLFSRFRLDPVRWAGDLGEALRLLGEALRAPVMSAVNRAMLRGRLAHCLVVRGARGDRDADIEAGLQIFGELCATLRPGSAPHAEAHAALANALFVKARRSRLPADAARASAAAQHAYQLSRSVSAFAAFNIASLWGEYAWEAGRLAEASEAYGHAVREVHRMAAAQALREDKYEVVQRIGELAARAAYGLAGRDPAAAAVALETGRALLATEVLERDRTDFDRLAAAGHQQLVERYRQVAAEVGRLERVAVATEPRLAVGSAGMAGTTGPQNSVSGAPATEVADPVALQRARTRLADVVTDIQAVPGFDDLLRPPDAAQLRRIAAERSDPIVYLAATRRGGLGVVLRAADRDACPVPLPRLTSAEVARVTRLCRVAAQEHNRIGFDRVVEWMWDAVLAPVLVNLGPARMAVLIPAGGLGQLPLHAAGYRDAGRPSGWHHAVDALALTYAPNARSLAAARRAARVAGRGSVLLAVGEPQPPPAGLPALPMAGAEVAAVSRHFPGTATLCTGPRATPAAVRGRLGSAQVYHFACHARIDPDAVLDSGLELAGGRLTTRDLLAADLRGGRLAVLSACATARADGTVPDEVIGLPTGMLQAGLAGVVASLWDADDRATMVLMSRFYRLWRGEGRPPAEALRDAQRWLRDVTNATLARELPELDQLGPAPGDGRWAGTRDFASPLYWAPFAYIGG